MNAKTSLLVAALSSSVLCAGCGPTLSYAPPTLTSGVGVSKGRRIPQSVFRLDDRIVMLVDVTWSDPLASGGLHECEWKWYRNGQLISDTPPVRISFRQTPTILHTARPAAPLGIGRFTVETLVDGTVVATSPFQIVG